MRDWFAGVVREIDSFFAALDNLSKQQRDLIGIVVLAVGVLFIVFGFKFFKYLLGLSGFLAGAVVGLTVFYYIPVINTTGQIGQLLMGAIVGAGGAALFYFLFYFFGIFIFGAVAAMWLAMLFLPRTSFLGESRLLVVLGLGFGGGLLALLMRKIIIVIATSAIGAVLITLGFGHFNAWPVSVTNMSVDSMISGYYIDAVYAHESMVIILTALIGSFVAGLVIQRYTARDAQLHGRER